MLDVHIMFLYNKIKMKMKGGQQGNPAHDHQTRKELKKMTMREKLTMHEQIEKENEKAKEVFDAIGMRYRADNMDSVFKNGDKLYLVKKQYALNGDIIVIRLPDPDRLYVCRAYNGPDGAFILKDDKNEPQIMKDPDIVGTVIGFERIF